MRFHLITFLALLIFAAGNGVKAQSESLLWRVDSIFGLSSTKKIDTNFFHLSPHGWMINQNNNFAMMGVNAEMTSIGGTSNKSTLSAFSNFNYTIGATIGYRNLILGYSFIKPAGKARDMQLALAANSWGVEFRRYLNDDMEGRVISTLTPTDITVKRGDINVESRYLRAYHVFSPLKFSLTAANDQRCIQSHSAGSILFFTDYSRHGIDFINPDISASFGGVDRIQMESAALGLGYGYNYTPNQGRLLLHLSAVPMFVVMINECIYSPTGIESYRNSRFRMQWFAKFTANYRINDYIGLNFIAVYYRTTLDVENTTHAAWNDISLRASFCCRF